MATQPARQPLVAPQTTTPSSPTPPSTMPVPPGDDGVVPNNPTPSPQAPAATNAQHEPDSGEPPANSSNNAIALSSGSVISTGLAATLLAAAGLIILRYRRRYQPSWPSPARHDIRWPWERLINRISATTGKSRFAMDTQTGEAIRDRTDDTPRVELGDITVDFPRSPVPDQWLDQETEKYETDNRGADEDQTTQDSPPLSGAFQPCAIGETMDGEDIRIEDLPTTGLVLTGPGAARALRATLLAALSVLELEEVSVLTTHQLWNTATMSAIVPPQVTIAKTTAGALDLLHDEATSRKHLEALGGTDWMPTVVAILPAEGDWTKVHAALRDGENWIRIVALATDPADANKTSIETSIAVDIDGTVTGSRLLRKFYMVTDDDTHQAVDLLGATHFTRDPSQTNAPPPINREHRTCNQNEQRWRHHNPRHTRKIRASPVSLPDHRRGNRRLRRAGV